MIPGIRPLALAMVLMASGAQAQQEPTVWDAGLRCFRPADAETCGLRYHTGDRRFSSLGTSRPEEEEAGIMEAVAPDGVDNEDRLVAPDGSSPPSAATSTRRRARANTSDPTGDQIQRELDAALQATTGAQLLSGGGLGGLINSAVGGAATDDGR